METSAAMEATTAAVEAPTTTKSTAMEAACACRKSSPSILVMQSTQDRTGQNASRCLGGT